MIGLGKRERIHGEGLGFNLISGFFPRRQRPELITAQISPAPGYRGALTFTLNNFSLFGATRGTRRGSAMPQPCVRPPPAPGGAQHPPNQHPPAAGGTLRRARAWAIHPAHPCLLINGDPPIRKGSAGVFYNLLTRSVEVTAAEVVTGLLTRG